MQDIKNFSVYQPSDKSRTAMQEIHGVAYLSSEDGQDWYECQATFSPDTLKVAYDAKGIICSIHRDVSMINPLNLSVAEVEDTPENQRADISGAWVYEDGEIRPRVYTAEEKQRQAQAMKTAILAAVEGRIAPLARAVKYGIATEAEAASLEALERYSIDVSRVDVADPHWPEPPAG